MTQRPFTEDEARDLADAITTAAARKGGRRFVVTVETTSGARVTGYIVASDEEQLRMVIEDPPENRGADVPWDEINAVRVHAE